MKIKTKLILGIGVLFTLIILLAFFTINQFETLAGASENIIKDNKETIVYSQGMLKALSEIHKNKNSIDTFENYLVKQKLNITEKGEKELTEKLSSNFILFKENLKDTVAFENIHSSLLKIINLNLTAIELKNTIARSTAHKSIILISVLSTFCFIVSLILFIKLPGNISNPIKELTKSTKQIAENDYSQRVNFENHTDFGELATSFNTMANKLEEYNRSNVSKLLAEKKIIELLLNKIHYPLIGIDKNLKVTLINEAFLKISGINKNEIIGKHILEIAHENDLVRQLIILNPEQSEIIASDDTNSKILVESQGKDIYFEKEIQEIAYSQHNEKESSSFGYVIILKNITKYMELDIAKTNFIATISHELKTPISAIKFSLQLLENEKTGFLNKEQHDLIKSCEDDTNHLLRIISELLNLTQVETGNIQLNIKPNKLNDILQFAVNSVRLAAESRSINIALHVSEELPEVIADKDKTVWVLTNLISNAIHYSNNNSSIKISAVNLYDQIKISVQDFGQGIDPRYKDKIFERYFRVPGTEKEGTGLGLAICKEFIEAQSGKIIVESEPGIGSIFSILLNSKP